MVNRHFKWSRDGKVWCGGDVAYIPNQETGSEQLVHGTERGNRTSHKYLSSGAFAAIEGPVSKPHSKSREIDCDIATCISLTCIE